MVSIFYMGIKSPTSEVAVASIIFFQKKKSETKDKVNNTIFKINYYSRIP